MPSTPPQTLATASPFLALPLELREEIYTHVFDPSSLLTPAKAGGFEYQFSLSLFRVSRSISLESRRIFRRCNTFVLILTPWLDTFKHIAHDNQVPVVAIAKDQRFKQDLVDAEIAIRAHREEAPCEIVVLERDLRAFADVWWYSSLNWGQLNQHLRVSYTRRHHAPPHPPSHNHTTKPISKDLQRRLLLPFGKVKGLWEVEINGYSSDIKAELLALLAIPHPTPAECIAQSTSLLSSGDAALEAGNPDKAIEMYTQAFHAIHIVVSGRDRRVMADNFFHVGIEDGPYAGQAGTTVRIILRIRLVSRFILAHLKLRQHEEAAFWGMRSIKTMRQAMDTEFEDFLSEFVGASDVGLIYLRTAIAFRKMEEGGSGELKDYETEEVGSSGKLFPIAVRYLGNAAGRGTIRKECEENGVRLEKKVLGDEEMSDVDSLAPMEREEV